MSAKRNTQERQGRRGTGGNVSDLDKRYGAIGIPAVAAAARYPSIAARRKDAEGPPADKHPATTRRREDTPA